MVIKKAVSASSLERSVLVRAPREEVYRSLTEEARLRVWFFDDTEFEAQVGGVMTFSGIEGAITATVVDIKPLERLSLQYDAPWFGVVTWSLSDTPTGTRVTLVHEGFTGREEWLMRFGWGWEAHLKNLKAFSEGKPIK